MASRGLDLPNLDLVIEYDPAFAKEDHLHRIGRTARLGRDGRATIFLLPGPEEEYVNVLRSSYKSTPDTSIAQSVTSTSATEILKKGFAPSTGLVGTKSSGTDHETLATKFQLDVERWVLSDPKVKELAKNGFQSHVRAYATHTAAERKYFDIKDLHLGHLAKAFGLRDAPAKMNVAGLRGKDKNTTNGGRSRPTKTINGGEGQAEQGVKRKAIPQADQVEDPEVAAEKMRAMIRDRKKMMGGGADEFNIA